MPTRPPAANSKHSRPSWLRYLIKHRLGLLLALEAFAIFAIAPLIELGMLPHILLGATFSLILLVGMLMLDLRSWEGRLLVCWAWRCCPSSSGATRGRTGWSWCSTRSA